MAVKQGLCTWKQTVSAQFLIKALRADKFNLGNFGAESRLKIAGTDDLAHGGAAGSLGHCQNIALPDYVCGLGAIVFKVCRKASLQPGNRLLLGERYE